MEYREDDEYLTEFICLDTINSLTTDRKNYFTFNYTFNKLNFNYIFIFFDFILYRLYKK
jgi:hypothetical protein